MADKTPDQLVREIMEGARIAAFAHHDDQGNIITVPMGVQKFDDPATTYWVTQKSSDKVRHLAADPRVNVYYASDDGYVSLTGTARLVEDQAKLKELWDFFTDAYMGGGPEDPDAGLLEVTGESASYWATDSAPVTLVKLVAAKVTGTQTESGDMGAVDL